MVNNCIFVGFVDIRRYKGGLKENGDRAMSDEKILEEFQRNKKEGFRLMYEKYADRLLSVCRRYSVDGGDAMDYLHEAMLKIYDKMDYFHLDGEGSLIRWMTRVAVNMILDTKKLEKRKNLAGLTENDSQEPEPSIDQIMELSFDMIDSMLSHLSPIKRTVFNLFYMEEYSHKEIAELLRITENGSSSILSKARKELAAMILDYLNSMR